MKIGIVGMGVVGTAVATGFKIKGFEVMCYDKYLRNINYSPLPDVVRHCEILFVCVPTPNAEDGSIDLSIVDDVIEKMDNLTKHYFFERLIVIKSTVAPGTTRANQEKYSDGNLLFFMSPEFLDSDSALKDFLEPDKIIIGYTDKSRTKTQIIESIFIQFDARIFMMPSDEAEMVKFATNAYFVLKTVFVNEMYDLCQKSDIDFERVRDAFVKNRRIGNSHFEPIHKGGRGAGGACLPKDLSAFIHFGDENKVSLELLKEVQTINTRLLEESGKK